MMPDYQKLYLTLFHAVEDAISMLEQAPDADLAVKFAVRDYLIQSEQLCEDIYCETD